MNCTYCLFPTQLIVLRGTVRLAMCAMAVIAIALTTPPTSAQTMWAVDDDAPGDPGPGDPSVSDPLGVEHEGRLFGGLDSPDTRNGLPPVESMGACEFGGTAPHPCGGDLDGDRGIDLADSNALLVDCGRDDGSTMCFDGDLDCDGSVGLTDLTELLRGHYGSTCG